MLRIDETTEYLIVEMGASGDRRDRPPGLDRDARTSAVVLKVGLAHAGEFGGIEAIQRAKAEMVHRPARGMPSPC